MKIANEFTVSAPIEQAWDVLTDLEQVIPLMPGAQLTGHEGDDYLGKVKVKVGPVTSEFSGKVHFVEQDRGQHRAVIDGKGKEARGTGNAAATVTAQLHEAGDQHPGHRRHRPEDRRQAGPVRQRHAAAGVGEVAGPVRGVAGGRSWPRDSRARAGPRSDGRALPRVVDAAQRPSPSPSTCSSSRAASAEEVRARRSAAHSLLAALVLRILRLRLALKALRGALMVHALAAQASTWRPSRRPWWRGLRGGGVAVSAEWTSHVSWQRCDTRHRTRVRRCTGRPG